MNQHVLPTLKDQIKKICRGLFSLYVPHLCGLLAFLTVVASQWLVLQSPSYWFRGKSGRSGINCFSRTAASAGGGSPAVSVSRPRNIK